MKRAAIQILLVGAALGLASKPAVAATASGPAAQPNRDIMRTAEEDFKAGRYADAAGLYEGVLKQAPYDPALLYNLGTALARAGRKGLAIWRCLQALELAPRDRDIRENLEILAPDFSRQIAITPIPPVNWLYYRFTANEWAATAGGASVLVMLLITLYLWQSRQGFIRSFTRVLIIPLAFVAVIAWPFAVAHFYIEDMAWRGIVVAENTVARTGPSESQIETYPLPVGTVIRILDDSTQGWVKFSYAGGRMGFVERDRVRFL